MKRKIAVSSLNASTLDIINTIRANASPEYQSQVPEIATEQEIVKVGDILLGYPSLANQFLSALVNRIALTRITSLTFNNMYKDLKKGKLEFGDVVEDLFVEMCKAREFSAEKAESREFKRYIPDVKAQFHNVNFRVLYPITIQEDDLRHAFIGTEGVINLVNKIVDSVDVSAEYDEYLLFKYLIIKAVSHGKMYPVGVDTDNLSNAAIAFRGISNQITFPSDKYNAYGVHTATPKDDQYIFMDAMFNAQYDVSVLASAFNMDKATFSGHLKLIDSFDTFDNDRFSEITAGSDQIEAVTPEELALMSDVVAVLVDKEFFQIYDNVQKMTETPVNSGLYWNYFYHTWKIVSFSIFSNAVVFVKDTASIALPNSISIEVQSKSDGETGTVLTFIVDDDNPALTPSNVKFVQTEALTTAGIAVHPYGAVIIPSAQSATEITLVCEINGATYTAASTVTSAGDVGDTVTLNKD